MSGVGCRVSGVGCREKLTLRLRSVLNFTQGVTKNSIVYSLARLESARSLPYLLLWAFVFL
ncbi:hypothetical protein [Coleofasciculus sp. E2-BRE-01]|uniref:hypothetical protein n=1 Tax=Coleofasciculus sp. E2-BRE-01 TaxID=3069524 RepID=UPI0032F8BEF8